MATRTRLDGSVAGGISCLPQHRPPRRRRATAPASASEATLPSRDTIHAIITKDADTYVVECHEIAVVTQGRTLDQALANLKEAVSLHLEGEDLVALGLHGLRRIQVSYELPADVTAA